MYSIRLLVFRHGIFGYTKSLHDVNEKRSQGELIFRASPLFSNSSYGGSKATVFLWYETIDG